MGVLGKQKGGKEEKSHICSSPPSSLNSFSTVTSLFQSESGLELLVGC